MRSPDSGETKGELRLAETNAHADGEASAFWAGHRATATAHQSDPSGAACGWRAATTRAAVPPAAVPSAEEAAALQAAVQALFRSTNALAQGQHEQAQQLAAQAFEAFAPPPPPTAAAAAPQLIIPGADPRAAAAAASDAGPSGASPAGAGDSTPLASGSYEAALSLLRHGDSLLRHHIEKLEGPGFAALLAGLGLAPADGASFPAVLAAARGTGREAELQAFMGQSMQLRGARAQGRFFYGLALIREAEAKALLLGHAVNGQEAAEKVAKFMGEVWEDAIGPAMAELLESQHPSSPVVISALQEHDRRGRAVVLCEDKSKPHAFRVGLDEQAKGLRGMYELAASQLAAQGGAAAAADAGESG
eukprot:scaffold12.g8194.t1